MPRDLARMDLALADGTISFATARCDVRAAHHLSEFYSEDGITVIVLGTSRRPTFGRLARLGERARASAWGAEPHKKR
jgi:hypothetical protein